MTVLKPTICKDCGRICYERGGLKMIEAAKMLDGTTPADEFLQRLLAQRKVTELADIAVRFEDFARYGTLQVPLQLNSLGDDLHEIKAGTVRLPFYYAAHPGVGAVRITSGFFKKQRFAENKHIRWARSIRTEDQQL